MSDVRSICAIGQRGQLGLNGRLPWEGRTERPFVEDVERFFELTRGHILIAGPATTNSVPDWARAERTFDHPLERAAGNGTRPLPRAGGIRRRRPQGVGRLCALY